MNTPNMITVVTVTIVNGDDEAESASRVTCGEDAGAVDDAKQEAEDEARERFTDNFSTDGGCRIFHSVVTMPRPSIESTEIRATLPEGPAEEPLTATVA